MVTETDTKILQALERDANRSRKSIAAEVNLTEPNLSKRIGLLVSSDIIRKFTIDINYKHRELGLSTLAVSLVSLKDQTEEVASSLVERLNNIDEAIEVFSVFEKYDLFVRWLCRDPAHLMRVIQQILGDGSVVQHVETIIFGAELKRVSGLRLVHE